MTDNTNNICHILNSFYCISVTVDYYQMSLFLFDVKRIVLLFQFLGVSAQEKNSKHICLFSEELKAKGYFSQ